MTVRMGSYISRKNVAAKVFKTNWVTGEMNLTTFGEFNPKSAVFYCSSLWHVNYGYFVYNGTTFYGYVDVSTRTKGGYLYSFTVDGLTTAYYAGCFNTNVYVEYAGIPYSNGLTEIGVRNCRDSRVMLDPQPTHIYKQIQGPSQDVYVIAVINRGYVSDVASSTTPTTDIYAFTPGQWNTFLNNLGEQMGNHEATYVNAIMNSITKTYLIPLNYFNLQRFKSVTEVLLGGMVSNQFGLDPGARTWSVENTPCYRIISGKTGEVSVLRNVEYNINMTPAQQEGNITIHCEFLGNISFKPITYGITAFKNLGLKIYIDYTGGQMLCMPYANYSRDKWKLGSAPTNFNTSIIDETLSLRGTFPETHPGVTSLGTEFYHQLASSCFSTVSGVTAGAFPTTRLDALSTGISIIGDVGGFVNEASRNGYNVTEGPVGGSLDRASTLGTYFYHTYQTEFDLTNFQRLYGRPVGTWMNLSDSMFNSVDHSGYCKTRDCQLQIAGGVPVYIVEEANSVLNSGAFIGSANMP